MAQSTEITNENIEKWKLFMRNSVIFLNMYRNLLDTYVLDFFTEDLWNSINPRWRDILSSLTPVQLANFLSCDEGLRQEKVWPLSLQAFRATAFTYSLPRKPVETDSPFMEYLFKQTEFCNQKLLLCEPPCLHQQQSHGQAQNEIESNESKQKTKKEDSQHCLSAVNKQSAGQLDGTHPLQQSSVSWGDATNELSPGAGQHKLLQHVFRRHLKPKKQHEVARLAYIAGKVAQAACNGVMIDVGSGQGHLSRFLAYGHNVRVVCLEAQDEFIKGAKKFDNQLEMAVEKMKRKNGAIPPLPPSPRHSVCQLEPNMNPEVFRKVVTSAWPELESQGSVCGLLGLHTCGDLAPTLLHIFTKLPTCHAVVSVGCCYMKLTVNEDNKDCLGYPMSTFVQSLKDNHLSYEAREVACHAIEMYTTRLKAGAENLKVHCYRAALEEIIVKHWPEHRHAGLRSVNHAHKMDFAQYAAAAVTRLDVTLNEEEIHSERTRLNLSRWMQVVVYYSSRLLLAPVVESIILLDRLFFLHENGVESVLLPAFDPNLSPRNHVLVAIKNKDRL